MKIAISTATYPTSSTGSIVLSINSHLSLAISFLPAVKEAIALPTLTRPIACSLYSYPFSCKGSLKCLTMQRVHLAATARD